MRRCLLLSLLVAVSLFAARRASADDILVPAGTLLRCTMNEPNFSSATAQIGDPVLCHLSSVQEFGRNAFPRRAYMTGHLEADKEPGHFWGKGYLKIVFDRIATPAADVNISTKVVGAQGYKVDKEGDIKGKGHATRDVVEWMIPPLWPWKLLMLPARGPRPTLKGEETITMRLMEDVTIPRPGAQYNSRDWLPPTSSYKPAVYYNDSPEAYRPANAASVTGTHKVLSVDSGLQQVAQKMETRPEPPGIVETAKVAERAVTASGLGHRETPSSSLTLIALRNETLYAVANYWLDGENLAFILPSGTQSSCALNEVDLARTTQLNAERGIAVTFREPPAPQPAVAISSATN